MAGNDVKHLDDATFAEAVASGVALVDFWAPWCGPCRMQGPILEEVAAEVGESVTIAKVNVDEAPRVANRFAIRAIPTLLVLKDGSVVEQFVGVQQTATLLQAIEAAEAESTEHRRAPARERGARWSW